jgi:uncharacterized membrane protein
MCAAAVQVAQLRYYRELCHFQLCVVTFRPLSPETPTNKIYLYRVERAASWKNIVRAQNWTISDVATVTLMSTERVKGDNGLLLFASAALPYSSLTS